MSGGTTEQERRRSARWASVLGLALCVLGGLPVVVSFVVVPAAKPSPDASGAGTLAGLVDGLAAMSRSDVVLAQHHHSSAPWVYVGLWATLGLGALVLMVNVIRFGVDRDEIRPLRRGQDEG